MRLLERSPSNSPCEDISIDERLFEACEAGDTGEAAHVWESPSLAVVVGRFSRVQHEVDEHACLDDGVPIVRRMSGGGAVVIGPGCLNYSLLLSLDARPQLRDIDRSYAVILGWLTDALGVAGVRRDGGSDLVLGDRKIGGSAQRRGRRALLHHGTLLYAFDPGAMERYLKLPPRQPAYRANRPHGAFVTNAPIEPSAVSTALARRLAA